MKLMKTATCIATILGIFAGNAQAGEPFHPFVDPVGDFFRIFFGWF